MLRDIGFGEILLILLLIVLLFGAKRLPDLARSLGRSLGEFKKGMREDGQGPQEPDSKEKKEDVEKKA